MGTISVADAGQEIYRAFVDQINERLEAKDVEDIRCPICGNDSWDVLGGTTISPFSVWGDQGSVTTKSLPTIPIGCRHCGFIAHFATGAYDLGE